MMISSNFLFSIFYFQQLFTPTLKGVVAENQAPFRDGVKLIFSFSLFS